MKTRPTREQIDAALLTAGQLDELAVSSFTLAAANADGGGEVTPAKRDELLAKCQTGEYVELYLDLDAYEQKPGEHNRKFVRIRDGAINAAAKSAKDRPFLRDHDQGNSLARGGTILESTATKRGAGDYVIRQRIKLTAPWAVDLALRGLLSFVSVGIRATGPVQCSHCGTEIFEKCYHFPGEHVGAEAGDESAICEWIFTAAELVETSSVNVPAVVGAHIESIRAAMSALPCGAETSAEGMNRIRASQKLLVLLGIAATASESEINSAVDRLAARVALEIEIAAEIEAARVDLAVAMIERNDLRAARVRANGHAQEAVANETPAQRELRDHGFNPKIVATQLAALGVKDPNAAIERRFTPRELLN